MMVFFMLQQQWGIVFIWVFLVKKFQSILCSCVSDQKEEGGFSLEGFKRSETIRK